ncbi:hypothetical protein TNCV_988461 [Trichonephila clavipes]|nr:hypothetical protein TNCV_988461 [Trichonephila clavipes]
MGFTLSMSHIFSTGFKSEGNASQSALAVTAKKSVLIRRCSSGVIWAITSNHITIILESLPKPGDGTMGDSKFVGYFPLGTPSFQMANNFTMQNII